jgi:hypothetical protein
MRGFILGLILVPLLVISTLSMRPGGLRQQLKNVARRFRLALVLGGIYFVGAALLRLALGSWPYADYGIAGFALLLGIVFLILGQDRPADS